MSDYADNAEKGGNEACLILMKRLSAENTKTDSA